MSSTSKKNKHMPCSACKFLRRRCTQDCIFLPHFPSAEPQKFIAVHRIFGASNINKILQFSALYIGIHFEQETPADNREDAVISMVYEATARLRDPVYGCVGIISALQKHVFHLQSELNEALAEVMSLQTQLSDALSLPSLIEGSPITPENHEFLHFQKPSEQNAYANASDALLLLPEAADHYCLQETEVLQLPYLDI
ncbi:PREDICTED: LOB domain-containing protein 25-like [Nicotiana attenuata]|uniref:LOB domain-containing protein 25-like n=1 Tax=Nicotiana attenuata TaxID=49451 RepID=UPI000904DA9D|nr:PREDICTED: LOB domain-containing protein 25-like [Nicotiana attenuata]